MEFVAFLRSGLPNVRVLTPRCGLRTTPRLCFLIHQRIVARSVSFEVARCHGGMGIRLRSSLGFHPEPSEQCSSQNIGHTHDSSNWEYELRAAECNGSERRSARDGIPSYEAFCEVFVSRNANWRNLKTRERGRRMAGVLLLAKPGEWPKSAARRHVRFRPSISKALSAWSEPGFAKSKTPATPWT